MIQICLEDKLKVYEAIRSGHIDAADLSSSNLIVSIILTMKRHGILTPPSVTLENKRRDNHHIPFDILLAPVATAKLKL